MILQNSYSHFYFFLADPHHSLVYPILKTLKMGQALIIGHEISQTEVNALFKFRCLIKTPQSE